MYGWDSGIDADGLLPKLSYGFGKCLLRISINGEFVDMGIDAKKEREKVLAFVTK